MKKSNRIIDQDLRACVKDILGMYGFTGEYVESAVAFILNGRGILSKSKHLRFISTRDGEFLDQAIRAAFEKPTKIKAPHIPSGLPEILDKYKLSMADFFGLQHYVDMQIMGEENEAADHPLRLMARIPERQAGEIFRLVTIVRLSKILGEMLDAKLSGDGHILKVNLVKKNNLDQWIN
jgi:hypothetical protein